MLIDKLELKHDTDLMAGAVFSDCGNFRYSLWRFWNYQVAKNGTAKAVMFIMANPSTAGKYKDDPTTTKCAKYAQRWGYDGLYIGNLFARIGTHYYPWLHKGEDATGQYCEEWLAIMRNSSERHIAAWGFMGGHHPERALEVKAMFPELYTLGISKDGQPKHPLYIPANQVPILWGK